MASFGIVLALKNAYCLTKSVLMKKTILFNLVVIIFYYLVIRMIGG